MKINLTKNNKRLLKKMIFSLIPKSKKIRFKKDNIIIKSGWFSKTLKVDVAEFILVNIPSLLNDLGNYLEYGEPYPYFENLSIAVEYFVDVDDIIKELYSQYSDIKLSHTINEEFEPKLSKVSKMVIVEAKRTKKLFISTVNNYKTRIDEVIKTSEQPLKVVHRSAIQTGRDPPKEHTFVLAQTG
jgi:hypothetical protein